ncbi:MAG: c-type cytochrome [Deltaproteobacteria bacterium]|nr:c-type cytochrome [Deltaproteobacteria bacterium]
MVPFGVHRGRFLRVGIALLALSAGIACGGDEDPPLPRASQGPVGLSDAEWGALLFRGRGCTGCHSLDSSESPAGSLSGIISVHRDGEADATDPAKDTRWAEELLLRDFHGAPQGRVQLELKPNEAHALSAFLARAR